MLNIYSCSRCDEIPLEPKMCGNCNSLVCYICLDKLGDHLKSNPENKVKCNDCDLELSIIDIQRITKKGLDMLRIKCPSNDLNCYAQVQLKDLNSHLESCKFYKGKARCNYCGLIDSVYYIKNHFNNCSENSIKCKFCSEIIKIKQLKEHEKNCPERPYKCNLCSTDLEDENISLHPTKDNCSLNLINELRNIIDGI